MNDVCPPLRARCSHRGGSITKSISRWSITKSIIYSVAFKNVTICIFLNTMKTQRAICVFIVCYKLIINKFKHKRRFYIISPFPSPMSSARAVHQGKRKNQHACCSPVITHTQTEIIYIPYEQRARCSPGQKTIK